MRKHFDLTKSCGWILVSFWEVLDQKSAVSFSQPDSEFRFKKVDPLSACVFLKKNLEAPRNQNQILPKKACFFR